MLASTAIVVAAFGLGRPLLRRLACCDDDALSVGVWSIALGLVVAALAMQMQAWLGWLNPFVVAGLTLLGLILALVEGLLVFGRRPSRHASSVAAVAGPTASRTQRPWGLATAVAVAGVVLVATFITALAPPTSYDALSRSLELPKNALLSHGSGPLGADLNIVQLWTVWALALDGPVAANLLHWALGVLVALSTVLLARPMLGSGVAWAAATLVLLSPGVQLHLGVPAEVLPLAWLATLALAGMRQAVAEFARGRPAIAAGVVLGAAIATRPAGAVLAAALVLVHLYSGWFSRWRRDVLRAVGQLSVAATLTATPWLITQFARDWSMPTAAALPALAMLGPLLAGAAGGILFVRRVRGLNQIVLVLAVYLTLAVLFWPTGWWSIVVPLASVAGAWVWFEVRRLPASVGAAVGMMALLVVVTSTIPILQAARVRWPVACGWQSRHAFLLEHEPTYRAASLLNQICAQDQRLYSQDARSYYFSCLTTRRPRNSGAKSLRQVPPDAADELSWATGEGYSYLLLAERVGVDGPTSTVAGKTHSMANEPTATGHVSGTSRQVIPILEYCFADDNNRSIRYTLLKLHGPRTADNGNDRVGDPRSYTR